MSFGIYLCGVLLLVAGLIYGAALLHLPAHWIIVGTLLALGFGVLAGVRSTRQRDPVE